MANKVGLYFGSFNPIHMGHLMLANYMLEFTDLKELWFVVSPHNPLKEKSGLLHQNHRLEMVKLAIEDYEFPEKLKASNIEFGLPQPSYTVNTLAHLKEKFPKKEFCLIMGMDNLQSFTKWKNYEEILKRHKIYVYPRKGYDEGQFKNHSSIVVTESPEFDISSTFIREARKKKKNVSFFMSPKAYQYMLEMHFYEK